MLRIRNNSGKVRYGEPFFFDDESVTKKKLETLRALRRRRQPAKWDGSKWLTMKSINRAVRHTSNMLQSWHVCICNQILTE